MKTHILTLAAIAAFTTLAAADSPDAILKDYRKQSTDSTKRLNETLEAQSAKIATELMRKGDSEGAKNVQTQIHQVLAGLPTSTIPAPLEDLLTKYRAAFNSAIAPVQKASIARIEAMLKMAGGQKMETVTELAKVRQEVESGKISDPRKIPVYWTHHDTLDGKVDSEITLNIDGTYLYKSRSETVTGTWKAVKYNYLTLNFKTDVWKITIENNIGTVQQDVGTRYMKVVTDTPPVPLVGGR